MDKRSSRLPPTCVDTCGYYAWAGRSAERRRQELVGAIEAVHADVRQRYGSPRMHAELKARGHDCSENAVAKLMRASGIRAKAPRRFVRATDSRHKLAVAENVLGRDFDPAGPNEAWCADITFVGTCEGWLYLAVVEDLFSRMVVGWSVAETLESRLVVDALSVAIARRRPGAGLLAHSDRGSQYASDHYQRSLAAEGIVCSMSGVGQCWDNAPVESFFGRMKCEIAGSEMFATRVEAKAEIFGYLEVFYNRVRLHSSLGSSPRPSTNGRFTRSTVNFVSAFRGEDQVDQRFIDEFLGHQTEAQRRRYRHLFPHQQREVLCQVFGG